MVDGVRPANLYHLTLSRDEPVCRSVLQSLNETVVATPEHRQSDGEGDPIADIDLLLSSKYEVSWQRRVINDPILSTVMDYTRIALDDDGVLRAVYRWGFDSKGGEAVLFVADDVDPGWSSEKPLTDDFIKKLAPGVIDINPENAQAMFKDDPLLLNNVGAINILSVSGRAFILAGGGNQIIKGFFDGRPYTLYLLRFKSKARLDMVCKYRGVPK